MMEEGYNKKIDAFLGGTLSSEESSDFLKEVAVSEELKDDIRLQDQLHHFLADRHFNNDDHSSNNYIEQLKEHISSDESLRIKQAIQNANDSFRDSKSDKRPLWKYFSVAAVIVLFIYGASSLLISPSESDLFETYYSTDDLPSFVQRGDELKDVDKAVSLFNEGDYKAALPLFEEYLSKENTNPLGYIYSALSHYNLGDKSKAIKELQILADSDSLDASRAYWYLALIHLNDGEIDKAKAALNRIVGDSENFKHKEAKELLSQL